MKKSLKTNGRAAEPTALYREPRVKIADFKAHLSRHLRTVRAGGMLTITDRDTPIARVLPFASRPDRLVVRPATKRWDEVEALLAKLRPVKLKTDPVDLIREMRKDRL